MAASTSRKRKATPLSPSAMPLVEKAPSKSRKRCDRRGCDKFNDYPFCFVQATDKCAGDGHTARWYHLSAGQHFCNECFDYFYRSSKPGNAVYSSWCSLWERESGERVAPGAKMFLVDQYLPFWVQCTMHECGRWRKLPPAIELHHVKQDIVKCTDCSRPEDKVVSMVKMTDWISSVSYTPMLRFSLLAPLLSEYFPDGVGISPATVRHTGNIRKRGSKLIVKKKEETSSTPGGVAQVTEGQGERKEGVASRENVEGSIVSGSQMEQGVVGDGGGQVEGSEGGDDGSQVKKKEAVVVEEGGKTGDKGAHLPPILLHPLHPFHHPHEGPRAQAFTPDVMEPVEIRAFPEYYRVYETQGKWHCPRLEIYCIMRNLILGLWFQNCKEYLTELKCICALSLRGLLRVWCSFHLPSVLHFLTLYGFVNHGFLDDIPRPLPFPRSDKKIRVLVIGAGSSGIAAANHLRNYGHTVRILEARDRLGGRVKDDFSLGPCVGMGAMFITGICNNPFTLLAEQQGIPLRVVDDNHCDLVTEGGRKVERDADMKVERHFNKTLDMLAEWRAGQSVDAGLGAKLDELHKTVVYREQAYLPYTTEETSLLDFHHSNLEFACGADLNKVSSLYWDHNDAFSQFTGPHAILPTGYHAILTGMARGIDILYNTIVQSIEVVGEGVRVGDQQGQTWEADKVVVTVPLSVLKAGHIKFSPPLDNKKTKAINILGAGLVEKVAIRFADPFWRKTLGSCDFFGHVTCNRDNRGLFGMFYDMSSVGLPSNTESVGSESRTEGVNLVTADNTPTQGSYVLQTTVSGNALTWYHTATDSQIIEACVKFLRLMFGSNNVSPVLGYLVSRWGSDSHSGMSYSYVAVGSTGVDYDLIAETAHNVIHFAGEATNRQHPQTVSGAYLSGIREACKIMNDII